MSSLIKNASIFSILSVVQKASGFILIPIYTTYLAVNEFGIYSILNSSFILLSIVILFGTSDGIVRKYHLNNKKNEFEIYCFNSFIVVFVFSIVILISCIVFSKIIEKFSFYSDIPFIPYLIIIIVAGILNSFLNLYQSILIAKEKSNQIAFLNLLYTVINIILIVIFVVLLKLKVFGLILALLITNVILGAFSIYKYLNICKFNYDFSVIKEIVTYSLPLLPHSLAGILMSTIDRFFLNSYINSESVGIYNLAFQFANILLVFISAFNKSYAPWFYKNYKNNNFFILKRASYIFMILIGFLSFGISIFSKEGYRLLVKEAYASSLDYVLFLVFTIALNTFYYIYIHSIYYNNTKLIPVITLSAAFVNIVLNYFLIPNYGIQGAIIASYISNIVRNIISVLISNRYNRIFKIFPLILIYILNLFMALIVSNYFNNFVYRAIITCVYIIIAIIVIKEKKLLKQIL